MSFAILKNICSAYFLQIFVKVSAAECIFSKIPCFQHILVIGFKRMNSNYENFPSRSILLFYYYYYLLFIILLLFIIVIFLIIINFYVIIFINIFH